MKVQPLLNRMLINLYQKNQSKSNHGFTMIELLVVILIIGILTAIAAPSWNALTTRQRLRSINNQVFQALQTAQAEAKRTKSNYLFEIDDSKDPPEYSIYMDGTDAAKKNWEKLNLEGSIKPNMIKAYAQANGDATQKTITFDHLGTVKDPTVESSGTNTDGFSVVIFQPDNKKLLKCSIVQTLLGTPRIAEGTECPEPQ